MRLTTTNVERITMSEFQGMFCVAGRRFKFEKRECVQFVWLVILLCTIEESILQNNFTENALDMR